MRYSKIRALSGTQDIVSALGMVEGSELPCKLMNSQRFSSVGHRIFVYWFRRRDGQGMAVPED